MRRFTVFFVDDEEVSRQRITSLIDWEKEGLTLSGVFRDGESAWQAMEAEMPDILITDINMPYMDGITLLEKLRSRASRTRVIFLTGYEYFEYARKAIELRAFDFLLKPVTAEVLLETLRRAIFEIEREEAAKVAEELGQELTRSEFVARLINGRESTENVVEEALRLGIPAENHVFLLVAAVADPAEGMAQADLDTTAVYRMLYDAALSLCREKSREGRQVQVFRARNRGSRYACLFTAPAPEGIPEEEARSFAEALHDRVTGETFRLTFAVGRCRELLSELPDSYAHLKEALNNRHILGVGRVLMRVDAIRRSQQETEQIVLPTDAFLKHIRQGEVEEVERDITSLYAKFRHQEYLSLESARMVTTELAITAFKGELSAPGESVSYLFYLNHIQQLMTLDEMEADIRKFACGIAEQRRKSGNSKRNTAERALEYLRSHYMEEDLSLNDVASHLAISVPYLAVLFKQETGRNFGAHLLGIRMDKAKELLRTTDMTISEISEAVGYGSPQYFSVCFKKFTGVTPGSYREM